jgi:hypothetical protein
VARAPPALAKLDRKTEFGKKQNEIWNRKEEKNEGKKKQTAFCFWLWGCLVGLIKAVGCRCRGGKK